MSTPGNIPHRSSLPNNSFQQYDPAFNEAQPRNQALFSSVLGDHAPLIGRQFTSQWRDGNNFSAGDFHGAWKGQGQQRPFGHMQEQSRQSHNINNINIVSEVGNVLLNRKPNEGPWIPHTSQQGVPQSFTGEQFRTQASGAFTVVPDTRSLVHQASFADSGYRSNSTHKRPAPLDEGFNNNLDQIFPGPHDFSMPYSAYRSPGSVQSDSQIHKKQRRATTSLLSCNWSGCEKANLKNKSDLQKHMKQHTKPHRCEQLGCERREGFGTPNDLERHRHSVHGLFPRCGTKAGFVCVACEQSQPGENKWWPRKDNFRSHIKRKHPDWKEDDLVDISKRTSRPHDTQTALLSAPSHQAEEDDRLNRDLAASLIEANQNDIFWPSPGNDGEIVAEGGQWTNADSGARDMPAGRPRIPTMATQRNFLLANSTMNPQLGASPTRSRSRFGDMVSSVGSITSPTNDTADSQDVNQPECKEPSASTQSTTGDHQQGAPSEGKFLCQQCGKTKKRACELRKHQKRHTRPYGCTFPRCFKRFGSRNDWKRHENTQHFLKDQWRCRVVTSDGTVCAKLFNKRNEMAAHLDAIHGRDGYHHDNPSHFTAISESHLGHEGHHHFWCGFCNDLIAQQKSVHQGHRDPRFQHIGDHFDKGKLTIDDWVDIEENKPKKLITPPKSTKANGNSRDSSADDSDLGEDGIPDSATFASGYTPSVNGSAGFGMDLPMRTGMFKRLDLEADAEGESDNEFGRRMI